MTQYHTPHITYRSLHHKENYRTIFLKNPKNPKTHRINDTESRYTFLTNKQWILTEQLAFLDMNVGNPCLNSLRGSLAALITIGVCQTKSWQLSTHNQLLFNSAPSQGATCFNTVLPALFSPLNQSLINSSNHLYMMCYTEIGFIKCLHYTTRIARTI